MVECLFVQRDAEEILKIPLSPAPTDDKLVCHFTKNGIFSIKSAYYLGINFMQRQTDVEAASCSERSQNKLSW